MAETNFREIGRTITKRCCVVALTMASPSIFGAEYVAFTAPFREIEIAAPEPGILSEVSAEIGKTVTSGEVLAKLDSRVLQSVLAVAKARAAAGGRVTAARASRNLRRERLAKLETLRASGNARADEIAIARAEFEIAEAELKSRKQEQHIEHLEMLKIKAQIERRSLRSPIDGQVLEVNKEVAERVGLNADDPVMKVAQTNPLRIEIFVASEDLKEITVGSKVPVSLPLSPDALTAEVDYIVPAVDPESGTTRVMLILPNEAGKLKSGIRCHVSIPNKGIAQASVQEQSKEGVLR